MYVFFIIFSFSSLPPCIFLLVARAENTELIAIICCRASVRAAHFNVRCAPLLRHAFLRKQESAPAYWPAGLKIMPALDSATSSSGTPAARGSPPPGRTARRRHPARPCDRATRHCTDTRTCVFAAGTRPSTPWQSRCCRFRADTEQRHRNCTSLAPRHCFAPRPVLRSGTATCCWGTPAGRKDPPSRGMIRRCRCKVSSPSTYSGSAS